MSLTPGTRLGSYEITAQIGAGGMGEVYRATDSNLKRSVAIKVLPASVSADADRLARFQREAEVLAALNHPNIGAVYGLETTPGLTGLVMELVEGDDLSQRIARGAIPIDEALPIAKQIAEALEAAHEQGIIHRDLKPANIKVRADGTVKVLDFGLAKAMDPAGTSSVDALNSPTMTARATQMGMIIGTAAYMAPEQAKGKSVDRRADIWAFGVVLYEMLTGQRAFTGDDVSETLASVLRDTPSLGALPPATPPQIRALVNDCLVRDPKRRLRDIGDARLVLDKIIAGAPDDAAPAPEAAREWLPWVLVAALFAVAATVSVIHFTEKPPAAPPMRRFQVRLPDKVTFTRSSTLVLSPDGNTVAFAAVGGADGASHIWVQSLDGAPARALSSTDVSANTPPPFWSRDGRFVVFSGTNKIRKVEVSNGVVEDVCDKPGPMVGGSWNQDGIIIFGSNNAGLWKTSAAGGKVVPLTVLDASRREREHELPQFLPDGRHFLYLRVSAQAELTGIYVGSIDEAPDRQNTRRLLDTGFGVTFLPSPDGRGGLLLAFRDGTVTAQRFNLQTLQLQGEAVVVAERVGFAYETPWFAASSNLLLYREMAPPALYRLTWMDDAEKNLGTLGDAFEDVSYPVLSPDGTRVAFSRPSVQGKDRDIWLLDVVRGVSMRFTLGTGDNLFPVWSPDGREIVFSSRRGSGAYSLYRKPADGSKPEELLLATKRNAAATSWSPDGQFLLYQQVGAPPDSNSHLWSLSLRGDAKPVALPATSYDEVQGRISPDGRWVAYSSNETGRDELYVREFTGAAEGGSAGGKWIVSKDGGYWPMWRKDGRELRYISGDLNTVLSVSVDPGRAFQAGLPHVVFRLPANRYRAGLAGTANLAYSGDLKRFLFPLPLEQTLPPAFMVLVNWPSGAKPQSQ